MSVVDTLEPACDDAAPDMTRGGYRENAGRPTAFPDKVIDSAFSMDFTPKGRALLDRIRTRTGHSRNDILAHLAVKYAQLLEFRADGVVFPGKAQKVMRIVMPKAPGARFEAAHIRTGKSYSDIGEALVTWYGVNEKDYPAITQKAHRRRRRKRR